ncbi:hypothetical protein SUGI_0203720 [Cryptomeria japonica]|uniref:glucan endo-1,3-beta-glucosidase 12 n=1 Tax=Cryptomeria japonica TaxID=3369 RepID=UPI002408D5EE|nr:glucan endo-1,3-beta-glucosidase 12 [Cryptomeria japonica]GLJ13032.1 hypothetical protein SUGI_0203720 [Cryptomeria japonica]
MGTQKIAVIIILGLLLATNPLADGGIGQWCIADPQAPPQILQGALDWACGAGGADCTAVQWNQPCFEPNTLVFHASYAFNSYWQKNKHKGASCHFNSASYVTESNPSSGGCKYMYVP